jgi:hypothetical protein
MTMFHWTGWRSLTSGKMFNFSSFRIWPINIFFIMWYVLSVSTNTWSALPPLNIGRTVHTMAFLNGELVRWIINLTFSCTHTLIGSNQNGLGHKQSWAPTMEKASDNQHTDTQPPTPENLIEGQGNLHFLHWQCNSSGYKLEHDNDSQQGDFF